MCKRRMNCVRCSIFVSGSGSTTLNKHEHGDRGCSVKKVDFANNIFYELGDCGASGLEKVHGKLFDKFSLATLVYIKQMKIIPSKLHRCLFIYTLYIYDVTAPPECKCHLLRDRIYLVSQSSKLHVGLLLYLHKPINHNELNQLIYHLAYNCSREFTSSYCRMSQTLFFLCIYIIYNSLYIFTFKVPL
jgi:hypothetical protein